MVGMRVLEADGLHVPAPFRVTRYIFTASLLSTVLMTKSTELNKTLYVQYGEGDRSIINCNDPGCREPPWGHTQGSAGMLDSI